MIYPTVGRMLSSFVFAALIGGAAIAVARRAGDKETPVATVALPVGVLVNFIFAALAPGAIMGRARFALRMATLALEEELT